MVQPPDLLIYLKASVPTLVSQIQKRGREYEENIRLDYLKRLNEYYNKWIDGYQEGPLLVIDCDKNKFDCNTNTNNPGEADCLDCTLGCNINSDNVQENCLEFERKDSVFKYFYRW
jgi:hypothetical protein